MLMYMHINNLFLSTYVVDIMYLLKVTIMHGFYLVLGIPFYLDTRLKYLLH